MSYSLYEALRELRTSNTQLTESRENRETLKFNNLIIYNDFCNTIFDNKTINFLKDVANNVSPDLIVLAQGEHHNGGGGSKNDNLVFIVIVSKNLYSEEELNDDSVIGLLIGFTGDKNWFNKESKVVRDVFIVNENNLNDIRILKTTNMQRYFGSIYYNGYKKYYPEIFKLKVSSGKNLVDFVNREKEPDYYNKYKLGTNYQYYDKPGKNANLVFDVKMDEPEESE